MSFFLKFILRQITVECYTLKKKNIECSKPFQREYTETTAGK